MITHEAAEIACLSLALKHEECCRELVSHPIDLFTSTRRKALCRILCDLMIKGDSLDPVAIQEVGLKRGDWSFTDDDKSRVSHFYLNELMDQAVVPAQMSAYLAILNRTAMQRRIQQAAEGIAKLTGAGLLAEDDMQEVVQRVHKLAVDLTTGDSSGAKTLTRFDRAAMQFVEEYAARVEATGERSPSGFVALDNKTNGLGKGELWILAARPGEGKSALAIDFAMHIAKRDPVVVINYEMTQAQVMQRVFAKMTRLQHKEFYGLPRKSTISKMLSAVGSSTMESIYISSDPSLTSFGVREILRKLEINERKRARLLIVDYLQLMPSRSKEQNREREVAQLSRDMKQIAMEYDMTVMLLSQFNRQADGEKPRLIHLRESGAIEQDADVVLAINQPAGAVDPEARREVELCVIKNRSGAKGDLSLVWSPTLTMFEDAISGWEENFDDTKPF
jgi:replicative DNA helicase